MCSGLKWCEEHKILNREEQESDEPLELFRNDSAGQGARKFFGFGLRLDGDGVEVEGSIVWLARFDAWLVTVVRCLIERKQSGGQKQKLYADTQGKILELAIAQLTESSQVIVQT